MLLLASSFILTKRKLVKIDNIKPRTRESRIRARVPGNHNTRTHNASKFTCTEPSRLAYDAIPLFLLSGGGGGGGGGGEDWEHPNLPAHAEILAENKNALFGLTDHQPETELLETT